MIALRRLSGSAAQATPAGGCACKKNGRLSVTTVNIRFDTTIFGQSDGPNNWQGRKKFLAEVVLRDAPDIIGTQEGPHDQLREFLGELGSRYAIADGHRTWRGKLFYPTLFFKRKAVSVLAAGDVWLSETPDVPGSKLPNSPWPRLMTWAVIEIRGRRYFVVDTQLENEVVAARRKQAEIVVQQITRLNTGKLPLLLMGDFNEKAGGAVSDIIARGLPDLRDAWQELGLPDKPTFNGFNLKSSDHPGRIDWILSSRGFRDPLMRIRDDYRLNPKTRRVQFPSDHNPVNLTLGAS